jgi:HAD superfamily hydrolase (TIGR01490 family)
VGVLGISPSEGSRRLSEPAPAAVVRLTRAGRRAYPDEVISAQRRAAAFFDLDKTIIARSSTLAFSRPLYAGGLLNRRAVLRSTYAHFMYLLSGADHEQMERMRDYLSSMVAGWDVAQVREIVAETLVGIVEPMVYREAVALIEEHHAAGRDVVIVSTSGAELVEPIAGLLGADSVIATRMVERDGLYTGEIDFYAYGPNKADAVRELAQQRGYDLAECYAYSDSFTDLPLLEAVGHPHTVNPDRALRRDAVTRGWPVLDFTQPAPLRRRFTGLTDAAGSRPGVVAAVAVTAFAVWATVVWAAARSRRAAEAAAIAMK